MKRVDIRAYKLGIFIGILGLLIDFVFIREFDLRRVLWTIAFVFMISFNFLMLRKHGRAQETRIDSAPE